VAHSYCAAPLLGKLLAWNPVQRGHRFQRNGGPHSGDCETLTFGYRPRAPGRDSNPPDG
jgi:hypothetical protein